MTDQPKSGDLQVWWVPQVPMTDQTDPAALVKRNEWKLPLANWLRDEINETLARYDVISDMYEQDVQIDALCVIAADKAESFFTIDPAALVKAALERAATVVDRRKSIIEVGTELSDRIRALADDPETVAGIIEQVKGETDG